MNKIICILLSIAMIIMCGCSKKQIVTNESDEFTMYSWHYEGDYGLSADLSFDDDNATFIVYDNGKKSLELNGIYSITEKQITITDTAMSYSISFDYELDGSTCKVSYGDNTITMSRIDTN